jgi:hypothetical protein
MAFEELLNKPMGERELLDRVIKEVQSHFGEYQNICFFLKLSKVDESTSQIVWLKTFKDGNELDDYYWDSTHHRSCIMVKSGRTKSCAFFRGYQILYRFEFTKDEITYEYRIEGPRHPDKEILISRELIDAAFGEIEEALSAVKPLKAM